MIKWHDMRHLARSLVLRCSINPAFLNLLFVCFLHSSSQVGRFSRCPSELPPPHPLKPSTICQHLTLLDSGAL